MRRKTAIFDFNFKPIHLQFSRTTTTTNKRNNNNKSTGIYIRMWMGSFRWQHQLIFFFYFFFLLFIFMCLLFMREFFFYFKYEMDWIDCLFHLNYIRTL